MISVPAFVVPVTVRSALLTDPPSLSNSITSQCRDAPSLASLLGSFNAKSLSPLYWGTVTYTLGQSVQGRELWAVLITDNPDDEEDDPDEGPVEGGAASGVVTLRDAVPDHQQAAEGLTGLDQNLLKPGLIFASG